MYETNLYTMLLEKTWTHHCQCAHCHVHKDKTPKPSENRDKLLVGSSGNIFWLALQIVDREQGSSPFESISATWQSRAKSQSTRSVIPH